MLKKRTCHKGCRAKKRRQRTRRRGGFKCFGFGCIGKPSVAPILPPPSPDAPVVVANPMIRFPDPAYLVVGGKRDPYDYKGVVDTRTFYSNPAYYILDRGEPITEERSRYITADFIDKAQMSGIAERFENRFDIIIFDWAVAEYFYYFDQFSEIVPFFRKMLKKGGKLVLDPSFHPKIDPKIDPDILRSSMNITIHSIEQLANKPTYLLMRQVINEVYIKNKMYREFSSSRNNMGIFNKTYVCYLTGKDSLES